MSGVFYNLMFPYYDYMTSLDWKPSFLVSSQWLKRYYYLLSSLIQWFTWFGNHTNNKVQLPTKQNILTQVLTVYIADIVLQMSIEIAKLLRYHFCWRSLLRTHSINPQNQPINEKVFPFKLQFRHTLPMPFLFCVYILPSEMITNLKT